MLSGLILSRSLSQLTNVIHEPIRSRDIYIPPTQSLSPAHSHYTKMTNLIHKEKSKHHYFLEKFSSQSRALTILKVLLHLHEYLLRGISVLYHLHEY